MKIVFSSDNLADYLAWNQKTVLWDHFS